MNELKRIDTAHQARRDLWIALTIGITFGIYHATTVSTWSGSDELIQPYTILSNGLVLIIFMLLWIAYRRWRQAEHNRREIQSIMRSISSEVIMLVNPDRRILSCNDAVEHLFGRHPEEVIGMLTDAFYEDRRIDKNHQGEIRKMLDAEGFHIGTAIGRRTDGSTMLLEISTERLKGKQGAVLVMRDVTERERNTTAIREAKEEVEQALAKLKQTEAMRNSLTHMIVHDMRRPIHSVLRATDSLLDTTIAAGADSNQEAVSICTTVKQQSQILSQMTNAVLDVNRMESGKMPIKPVPVNLRDVVETACRAVPYITSLHPVQMDFSRYSGYVRCDPDIIRRVLINLLIHASKFAGPEDRITIRLADQASDMVLSEFNFHNPRIPMSETVADTAPDFKQESELGIVFCRLAATSHGGTMGISETGTDQDVITTCWFTLPRPAEAPVA